MGALFEGRREFFGGLAIDMLDWDWKKHPIIRFDLNAGNYIEGADILEKTLNNSLRNTAAAAGLPIRGEIISDKFGNLIMDMAKKYDEKCVVIIDEYDKPLLNTIDEPEVHAALRNALKAFYGVLKSSDAYLRFVFFTGVTKFAQVSIFSDLNYITDISLDPRYAALCGITQEEMERDFKGEIEDVIQNNRKDRLEYMERLKRFYNGYRFSKRMLAVYNPYGLLKHFDSGDFASYWYETGTPTFLIRLIEAQKIDIFNLDNETVSSYDFAKFDVATMQAVPVLYQSGYLTIVAYDEETDIYTLDYPNDEVRASFAHSLLEHYVPSLNESALMVKLPGALIKGEIENAITALKIFFKKIPSDLYVKHEKCYEMVVYLVFRMLGLQCNSEVRLADGRIDALVETKNNVYCFEFKLDHTADEALLQIDNKEYLLPWRGSGKKLFKVGVNFDHEARNIAEWKCRLEA